MVCMDGPFTNDAEPSMLQQANAIRRQGKAILRHLSKRDLHDHCTGSQQKLKSTPLLRTGG